MNENGTRVIHYYLGRDSTMQTRHIEHLGMFFSNKKNTLN
jgi:hypothetical protein